MKKILITGGTGTVGKSFIKEYYDDYMFYTISRNETGITELLREFPNVTPHIGNICDRDHMINLFCKIKPDIVIHAAALKHINLAEENPTSAVEINVVGSLNVAKASIRADVSLTIGVSTDKACNPDSVYGYTKRMMETMFMQYHNDTTKFICTRFANVANSNGSVIPFWISEATKGKSLSDKEIEIIGKRPGEKLNETLISEKELPFTNVIKDYVYIFTKEMNNNLTKEHSSANAEWMSTEELERLVWN